MAIELSDHQIKAIGRLKTGSILQGGVGSGKSRTAIAYYYSRVCKGEFPINGKGKYLPMQEPRPLYIITTARKRDTLDWEKECAPFGLVKPDFTVDSWNRIKKYEKVKNAFFIFDEQRVVGKGEWVSSFLKITKVNEWILLSATPGDRWLDYIPVFIANGFYKNRTEFMREHVVFSRFHKYLKVQRYIAGNKLLRLRNDILVPMDFDRPTIRHHENMTADYDRIMYKNVMRNRWNPYANEPITDISGLCMVIRKIVNSDPSRLDILRDLIEKHKRVIVFYNFNYELDLLHKFSKAIDIQTAEWNGHKHELIPVGDKWMYLVQYTAGAEGWNCIETDTMIFYSQNYSYRIMEQASGRIDRMNTPFRDLYYYHIRSTAPIDLAILKALNNKKDFNETRYFSHSREKHTL